MRAEPSFEIPALGFGTWTDLTCELDGNIFVWSAWNTRNYYYMLGTYDFESGTRRILEQAGGGSGFRWPDVSGDLVAYPDNRPDFVQRIWVYDLADSSKRAVSGGSSWSPLISGEYVVWSDTRDTATTGVDIYGYDLSIGTEFPICTDPGDQVGASLDGNFVVWTSYGADPLQRDIWGYDLSTRTRFPICTVTDVQERPYVAGNIVVWEDARNPDSRDVYGLDLSSLTEFPICTDDLTIGNPVVSGNIVVWQTEANWPVSGIDLMGYDLVSGTEFTVCDDPGDQVLPRISGNKVVWANYLDGAWTFRGTTLLPAGPDAPTGFTVTDYPLDNGRALDLSWAASDGAVGYRLSRGTTSGVYDHEVDLGDLTAYVDTNLTSGQTYYYAVRACDGEGNLSDLSAEVSAVPLDNGTGAEVGWVWTGTPATVEVGGITITFDDVTAPGTVAITPTGPGGGVPEGFRLLRGDWLVNISVTAAFIGSATIVFPYDEEDLPPGAKESELRVFHFEGGWRDVTVPPVDTLNNRITARVTQFSPFALVVPAPTRYQQNDPKLAYAGAWSRDIADPLASGGSYRQANTSRASITATFNGTAISYIAKTSTSFGMARVTLDGTSTLVSLYTPVALCQRLVWSAAGLSPGTHTLVIERIGTSGDGRGSPINVDGFDIVGTLEQACPWPIGPAPTVTRLHPSCGSSAGGTAVVIVGKNFTGVSAVTFGGVAAIAYTVVSSTKICATSPPHSAGVVQVQVTAAGGTSQDTAADNYTYLEAPPASSRPTHACFTPVSGALTSMIPPLQGAVSDKRA